MPSARALCLWLLTSVSCATAPPPGSGSGSLADIPKALPSRTREPQPPTGRSLHVSPQRGEVVETQAFIPAGEVAVPAPLAGPVAPSALPGPFPLVEVPEDGWSDSGRSSHPSEVEPQAKQEKRTPTPPSPPAPEDPPAPPLTDKPDPAATERTPEEAVRRAGGRKTAPEPRPPHVSVPDETWEPEPGQRWDGPCTWKGSGGPGSSRPENAPPDWVHCRYQCGKYQVELFDILGKSGADCNRPHLFKRAEELAKAFHKRRAKGS